MRFDSVNQWLDWQMSLHDQAIELGLERLHEVAQRLLSGAIAGRVITVAGTNGKGSTVACYETWLRQAGFSVASYTSPHLLSYNERIKHNLDAVGDSALCEAFAAVETARAGSALTFFEFGTLAALWLFQRWQPDFLLLEVGLGGRLDAVNIIDADLVHLTPISIDHQAWLGHDREQIGFEKAGVLRPGIDVILNDPDPPQSVLARIESEACRCLQINRDYQIDRQANGQLRWRQRDWQIDLDPVLVGEHQDSNLAGVVAGLSMLLPSADYTALEWRENFHGTHLAGRFQEVFGVMAGRLFVDVGHNPDAARALARNLESLCPADSKILVLLGMLDDKQPQQFVDALAPAVDRWWLTTLPAERGLGASQLRSRIGPRIEVEKLFENPALALEHALSSLGNQDIMLVTGSFVTVELLLRALPDSGELTKYGSKH